MYVVEHKQMDGGVWLSGGNDGYLMLEDAKRAADAAQATYHCPKRVVAAISGEVVYTVGETPEYEAFAEKARAKLAELNAAVAEPVRFMAVPRYVFDRSAGASHQDLVTVALVHGPRDGVSIVSREGRTAEVISTELYTLC